jgi:hypothetical protein
MYLTVTKIIDRNNNI